MSQLSYSQIRRKKVQIMYIKRSNCMILLPLYITGETRAYQAQYSALRIRWWIVKSAFFNCFLSYFLVSLNPTGLWYGTLLLVWRPKQLKYIGLWRFYSFLILEARIHNFIGKYIYHCPLKIHAKGRVRLPNRMNFWKSSKGGGGLFSIQKFISQILEALNRAFWAWNWYKKE